MEILVAGKQETIKFWEALLIEEELVTRSLVYMEPWHSRPAIAIPVGKHRRTGYCQVHNEEFREEVMRKMRMMPLSFPDLRISKRVSNEIEWGDDIGDLWVKSENAFALDNEIHRLIGTAFGYKEERILTLYPLSGKRNVKEYVEKYNLK